MRLTIFFDHRFVFDAAGHLTSTQNFTAEYFESRYLQVFTDVRICARIAGSGRAHIGREVSLGPHVTVVDCGDWQGPFQALCRLPMLCGVLERELRAQARFDVILPGLLPSFAIWLLVVRARWFGAEISGDPWDVFSPGAYQSPARILARWGGRLLLRWQVRRAASVTYVTEHFLQRRYPCRPDVFQNAASKVELLDDAFAPHARHYETSELQAPRLVYVGTLAQLYKAPDDVIRAVALLRQQGIACTLTFVGDGSERMMLETLAAELQITDAVTFLGRLPAGSAIRAVLDAHDIYVLPSRAEGLPRALIEAMARGMYCIGSDAGGIPELLTATDCVTSNAPSSLADAIKSAINDPARMNLMARRNLERAQDFRASSLRERRMAFYRSLITLSSASGGG